MRNAMHALSQFVADPDINFFPALKEGAPTGFQHDIPQSFVFRAIRISTSKSCRNILATGSLLRMM